MDWPDRRCLGACLPAAREGPFSPDTELLAARHGAEEEGERKRRGEKKEKKKKKKGAHKKTV